MKDDITVRNFVELLSRNDKAKVKHKIKGIARESLYEGGNDMWLAWVLKKNITEIHKIAQQ